MRFTKQKVFSQYFSLAATVCNLESSEIIYNIFHGGKNVYSLPCYLFKGFLGQEFLELKTSVSWDK